MLTIYYKRVFLYLSLHFCISAHAQDLQQNLDFFSGKFMTAIKSQEKARAHLVSDKSIYKPGESIWFRGFLLNGVSQKVYSSNKYLFVDLVNEKDSVISIVLLNAASQQLNGQIILPANIPAGYYWLRAYTKQMAEGDTNNCFVKSIYVISKSDQFASGMPVSKIAATNDGIPDMKFFPEGGAIMTGTNSNVAFLIRDPEQRPVAAEGYIKDNRDSIVAHFISGKSGLGKFDFSPTSFKKYKAFINFNGKEIGYPLPAFNFYAGQISVTKQAAGSRILRVLLEDSIYKKDLVTYLIGVSKDSLCFAVIGRGQYELPVPEENFPEGIATFYLFDNNLKYLSERSIYVKRNNLIVKTSLDKNDYGKRDKVKLDISVTDAGNHPVTALFSVAVTDTAFLIPADESILPDFDDARLISNMNLVQLPFLSEEDLDLVMLLKNYTFQDRSRQMINASRVDSDSLLFINGKVLDEKNNPATNKILTLFSNSSNEVFVTDTTDNAGQFSFAVSNYVDSTQFAIEARNLNSSSIKVNILRDPILFPHFSTPASLKNRFAAIPVFTNNYRSAYLDTPYLNPVKKLPPVTVRGKKEANYNQSRRVSGYSTILTSDQLNERNSVANALLQVGGVHVLNGYLVINGLTQMAGPDRTSEPLLLIDGAEAPQAGAGPGETSPVMATLNSINPKEIDFIEVLKGADGANYGVRGGHGVILVNMSSNHTEKFMGSASNLQSFYAKGISRPSLYPAINYDSKGARSSEDFDNRSTIFWDGSILTSAEGPASVSFFTSDVPTTYKITISGITVHGGIIYKTLTFHTK